MGLCFAPGFFAFVFGSFVATFFVALFGSTFVFGSALFFWLWSFLGFNISIDNLILRVVLILVIVNMTTPAAVRHGLVTFSTFDSFGTASPRGARNLE